MICQAYEQPLQHVINFCIIYIKYYIYLQRLFNNNQLDVYSCQALIKSALDIENEICIKNRITLKFQKINFVYLNL